MVKIYSQVTKKIKGARVLKDYEGRKVLAFSPHSDDLSISAGGFLYNLAKNNQVIPVLGFTGWRGVDQRTTKQKAEALREAEMTKEAKVLRMEKPIFLRLRAYDRDDIVNRRRDAKAVREVMYQTRPDIIFVPNKKDRQPRHRILTKLVLRALAGLDKEVVVFFYETPWSLFSPEQINFLVPLSSEAVKKKIQGVRSHSSQLTRTDFVKISNAMLEYRALVSPEQLVGGFGSGLSLGNWIEAFSCERYKSK